MHLLLKLAEQNTDFDFTWEPLVARSARCYIWQCAQVKSGIDLAVVYRHVLDMPQVGIVTVYIGEGESLNGPAKHNLVYQYSGHGDTRQRVRRYLESHPESGWTEILKLEKPSLDLKDDRLRKFVQDTLIAVYFWEHRQLQKLVTNLSEFLNKP